MDVTHKHEITMTKLISIVLLFGMLNVIFGQAIDSLSALPTKRGELALNWDFEEPVIEANVEAKTDDCVCDTLTVRQDWQMAVAWFGFFTFITWIVSEWGRDHSAQRYTMVE